jgi:hypothetical protein
MLIFKSEQLREDPAETLARIATFLDITPFPPVASKTMNAREYDRVMSEEEKGYLTQVLGPEIRELERLLGWDCSDWLR